MDDTEPTSPGAPHAGNPTDSMVTVSLSDIQSNSEHSQPDCPQTPVEDRQVESETTYKTEEESISPVPLRDAVNATPVPADEDDLDEGENLDLVDWENLEKTEEQEPRGEGSDEVGGSRDRSPASPLKD